MTYKSYYYFVTQENDKFCFFNSNFEPLEKVTLDGLFAFIRYTSPELMVIGKLMDYGSQHSGLDSMVQVLKKHATAFRDHFFKTKSSPFHLPKEKPTLGGGILYLGNQSGNQVVLWHLKSGSISRDNPDCHDDSPELKAVIQATGFPPERFIKVKQADFFDKMYLRELFLPDGQYKNPYATKDIASKICRVMELPPVYDYNPDDVKTPSDEFTPN